MKRIILKIGIVFSLTLFIGSCEKWIDPEINISPNSPTDAPLAVLLPSAQAALFYVGGNDHSMAPSVWVQHRAGVDRQAGAMEVYNYQESDCNNLWNTLNATVMKNLSIIIKKGEATNSPHYSAVAKILMAAALERATVVWGDIPYSDAWKADVTGDITAAYDTQEAIYASIQILLTEAITEIQATTSTFALTATSDQIYKGNLTKWRRLAWTMKLRCALQLEKINGIAPAVTVLTTPGAIFLSSNDDDFQFNFGAVAVERNPRFNFESSRGDLRVGKFLVDLMNASSDPRRSAFFTSTSTVTPTYVGSGPGEMRATASRLGPFYGSQNSPVAFLTFAEYQFMVSELRFKQANLPGAADAHNAGVVASLAKHNARSVAWELANANETGASITFQKIMMAKYVALFLQTEVWGDWRRTGIPSLTVATDAVVNQIPRRYPYPLNERLYNGDNLPTPLPTVTDRVWWDKL
jgi:hypothetical protein